MRNLMFLPMLLLYAVSIGQNPVTNEPGEKVIIDNEKMKVVEHVSQPKGDVCGVGMHHHEPHLTIVLTDSKVRITPENGQPQEMEVKSGTSIWFDAAETHSASNIGDQPTKMILVYLKE
jgi:mannose-6-phosphate isomerase-like protein (cupin superfamily)